MASTNHVVRVGLIGPGSVAENWLIPALNRLPQAAFWSVLGRDAAKAAAFAGKLGAKSPKPGHMDIDEFLADPDLDAVIIATPDRLHAQQAIAAAKAGKHIFVEKPIATTFPDAQAILAASRQANVRLAVGYHLRFHTGHRQVFELLKQNAIGDLLHFNLQWTLRAEPSDWRASSTQGRWWSLAALGTHGIDLANWLLEPSCGAIAQASALTSNGVYKGPHDETSLVSLRFASGATATIMSSVVFKAPRRFEIYGSKGSIVCQDTIGARGAGSILVNGEPLEFATVIPYEPELAHFLAAITTGGAIENSGEVGAANVALLERISP